MARCRSALLFFVDPRSYDRSPVASSTCAHVKPLRDSIAKTSAASANSVECSVSGVSSTHQTSSWSGVGPGNSTQRNYVPSAHADFIYSIIVEEYGAIGGILILLLYVLFFFRIVRLVTKSSKALGAMVAFGIGLALLLQAFFNIAVNLDLVPVTGLTLPLISMGGTSVLFTCVSFGIILSVSKHIESITADAT